MRVKKICEKLIICILVFLIIFNFMIAPVEKLNIVYAATSTDTDADDDSDGDTTTEEAAAQLENDTNASLSGFLNGLAGILTWIPRAGMIAFGAGLQLVGYSVLGSAGSDDSVNILNLTPFDIFFNKFTLTNINIFQTDDVEKGDLVYNIRLFAAALYYIIWCIALAVLLIMLILIGIKVAMATLAEDRARWKQAFVDWLVSALLVVCMSFIVVGIININNSFVSVLENVADGVFESISDDGLDTSSFMDSLRSEALTGGFIMGWACTIIYFLMILQTIIFGVVYIIRFLIITGLIVVSPLVPLFYSIDRAKGGHSQVLNLWFKEFCYNVFIQLIHCLIYIAIVSVPMASIGAEVSTWESLAAAILSILAMMSVKKIEELLKSIFGFDKARSLSSYSSIVNAHNINTAAITSSVMHTAVGVYGKGVSFGHDVLRNNTGLGKAEDWALTKVSNVKDKISEKAESLRTGAATRDRYVSDSTSQSTTSSESNTESSTSEEVETVNVSDVLDKDGNVLASYSSNDEADSDSRNRLQNAVNSARDANELNQGVEYDANGNPIAVAAASAIATSELANNGETDEENKENEEIANQMDELEKNQEDMDEESDETLDEVEKKSDEFTKEIEKLKEELLSEIKGMQEKLIEKNSYETNKRKFEEVRGFNLEEAKKILENAKNEKDKSKALEDLYKGKEESNSNFKRAEYAWALNEFEHGESAKEFKNSQNDYLETVDSALGNKLISVEQAEKLRNIGMGKSEEETKAEVSEILPKPKEDAAKSELMLSDIAVQRMRVPTIKNARMLEMFQGDIQIEGDFSNANMLNFDVKILEKLKQGAYSQSNLKIAEEKVRREGDAAVKRMNNFINNQNTTTAATLKTKAEKEYGSLIVESQQAGMIVASANMSINSAYSESSSLDYGVSQEQATVNSQGVIDTLNSRKDNNIIDIGQYRNSRNM